MAFTTRLKLAGTGWTQLSLNVWTKDGFTALIRESGVTMISPIGKRIERTW
jgi:hypothetical protein